MKKNMTLLQDLYTYIDSLDIIGDIHGCYHTLIDLLIKLGYSQKNGIWQHPKRKAIFIGDYIDRGIYIDQSLSLIKNMVDNGKAVALLGNHEMNLIGIFIKGPDNQPLRSHNKIKQHRITLKTLNQHKLYYWIEWFKKLPIFIDLKKLRIIHAAWHTHYIKIIKQFLPNNMLSDNLSLAFNTKSEFGKALRYVLKGPEIPLSKNLLDLIGKNMANLKFKKEARIKWWNNSAYTQILLNNGTSITLNFNLKDLYEPYPDNAPILFFGHYSMDIKPQIIRNNVQCVDFGAYKKNFLVAYSYNGEKKLLKENLKFVPYNNKDLIF